MANDKSNMRNFLKPDTVIKFTKSSTVTQVDAVTTKAGKVIERIQYKDTVSPAGVQKTLNRLKQVSISRRSSVEQLKQLKSIIRQQRQMMCQKL